MQVPGNEEWWNKIQSGEREGDGDLNKDFNRFPNTQHINKMSRRNSYKAVMKNGELVESQNGHLIVTHNLTLNNNQEHVDSDTPLDLSINSPQSNQDDTG